MASAMDARVPDLPFTGPYLLAPMEGVTEPCFRALVLARNPPEALGGAFTEFVRVSNAPTPAKVLRRHLGARRFAIPVGLQLMGSEPELVAQSARNAELAGAPLVDLNFGCPARGAVSSCAGSGLLAHPERIEALVRACRSALERVPLSAKIRAGIRDDAQLEQLALAVEAGGAALLTVHCRTREEAYRDCADWKRIARAVAAVRIPVCGNGGVHDHAALERLRRETGARYAMVGRAALGDPWIFSGRRVSAAEAAGFLLEYAQVLHDELGFPWAGAAARVKQLLHYWEAGALLGEEPERVAAQRRALLRECDPRALFGWIRAHAGESLGSSSAPPVELGAALAAGN